MDSPKAVEPTSRIRLAAAVITAFIVTASVTHSLMARRDVRRLRAELMAAHENQETLKAKADGAKGEASAARQEAEAAKNSVAELRDRLAQAQQEQVKVTRETTVANSNPGRDRHRTVCRSHLRQLGMALCMYAQQREGAYPTTLDELLPNYIDPKAEHLLRCPGDTNPIATPAGRACSFRYIGGPTFPRSPRAVILFEKPGNHAHARFVMCSDMAIEWIPECDFATRLKNCLTRMKVGRNSEWSVLGAERKSAIEAFYSDTLGL